MNYNDLVKDFAMRTRSNTTILRNIQKSNPEIEVYEVTQLINSMLGLIVLPQQLYVDQIPKTSVYQLKKQGWPIPTMVSSSNRQLKDLNAFVRFLRNSISHFNLSFESDDNQITGLQMWNINPRTGKETGRVKLSLAELESISNKFTEMILNS